MEQGQSYNGRIFTYSKFPRNKDATQSNKDQVLLNLNCLGKGYFHNEVLQGFSNLEVCYFAIGVYAREMDNNYGVSYTLLTKGQNIVKGLPLEKSTQVTLAKKEHAFFRVNLPPAMIKSERYVNVKMSTLDCVGKVFASKSIQNPSKGDNDGSISLFNLDVQTLRANTYNLKLSTAGMAHKNGFYLAIEAESYCVIDLYVSKLKPRERNPSEQLHMNKLTHRSIARQDKVREGSLVFYPANFFFRFDEFSAKADYLEIQLDSHVLHMEICVQFNRRDFDYSLPCDAVSESETLRIEKSPLIFSENRELAISIRKKLEPSDFFNAFPIEFSVHVNSNSQYSKMMMHLPGVIHSRSIAAQGHIIYQMDLTKMKDKAVIILTSEHPNVYASVSYTRASIGQPKEMLNQNNFAYELRNTHNMFKAKYCRSKSCYVYVVVHNKSKDAAFRFSLVYAIDQEPINLKEGQELFVPAPVRTSFLLRGQSGSPMSFNFQSDVTRLVAYGSVVNEKDLDVYLLDDLLNEYRFQHKTNIDKSDQIAIKTRQLQRYRKPFGLFLLVPKFDFEDVERSSFRQDILYDKTAKVRVVAHNGLQKLEPYKDVQQRIQKGDFLYFDLHLDSFEEFTVFLSLHSGACQMFLNKGSGNLPTLQDYALKGTSLKGEQFQIDSSTFPEEKEPPLSYTIGIYAKRTSIFSLMYHPHFANIINMQYQRLTEKLLLQGKTYYFDFYHKNQVFNSMLYASGSDVQVGLLEYKKSQYVDFKTVV
jgi:hypothetical protein